MKKNAIFNYNDRKKSEALAKARGQKKVLLHELFMNRKYKE